MLPALAAWWLVVLASPWDFIYELGGATSSTSLPTCDSWGRTFLPIITPDRAVGTIGEFRCLTCLR